MKQAFRGVVREHLRVFYLPCPPKLDRAKISTDTIPKITIEAAPPCSTTPQYLTVPALHHKRLKNIPIRLTRGALFSRGPTQFAYFREDFVGGQGCCRVLSETDVR